MIKIALSVVGGLFALSLMNSKDETQVPLDIIEPEKIKRKRKRK